MAIPVRAILALIGLGGLVVAACNLAAPTWWGVTAAILLIWMGLRAGERS